MHDPASTVIFWGTILLLVGILGRYIAERLHQPPVLGELVMGILLGNICYGLGVPMLVVLRDIPAVFSIIQHLLAGIPLSKAVHQVISEPQYAERVLAALSYTNAAGWVQVTYVVDTFSRYGVIFLLFMVGLDSSLGEFKKTGRDSFWVACLGVLAPTVLGLLILPWLFPNMEFRVLLFVSATLCATSVGITARVLRDLHQLQSREAKTILGAAMIDDVLGLIILSVVSNLVLQDGLQWLSLVKTIGSAILFFPIVLLTGPWLLERMVLVGGFLNAWEAKLFIGFLFLMLCCWFATVLQLSSIVGAFVAGMILHDGFFAPIPHEKKSAMEMKQLMAPLEAIFAPLFFVLIGIQVRMENFLNWHVLWIAVVLTIIAVIGKLLSGLGASKRNNRGLIGIGMMPRGEVGLIFASVGKSIGIIPDALFASIVLMVIVTTFLTPPWIKRALIRVT